jgi:zinc protease
VRLALPFCFCLCLTGIAAGNGAEASAPPENDLPVDRLVSYGALSNGVRYVLRPRSGSAGRISLRLVVDAGSLNERPDQRGLAHLLEHMAFNGSTHFPAGMIFEYFQRQGMSIGADANANTSFERTTYLLELRRNDPATLGQGLSLFKDFASGLLLPPAMLAKERGVVESERIARDSVAARVQADQLRFCLAGTILPDRLAIGDPAVIAHATTARLREFYDAWYRPDRLTLVAVGDFDPAGMAATIKRQFGKLRARARAQPTPAFGTIANTPGIHVKFLGDTQLPGTNINFTVLHQQAAPADSAETRLHDLARQMAFVMFSRRLNDLAQRNGAPFNQAAAVCGERLNRFEETSMTLAGPGSRWQATLAAGEHELRRALQYGFDASELKVAGEIFTQRLEQAVRAAPTTPAAITANALIECLKSGQTYMTTADLLMLYTPALAQMTVANCNEAFRQAWLSPARFVSVAGDAAISGNADQAVQAAYRLAASEPVTRNAAAELAQWSYTAFGPPGAIASRSYAHPPDVTLLKFANGARVNLKPTHFEANRVRLQVRVGTGRLQEPAAKPGLAIFAEHAFLAGGLNRYDQTELAQVIAGKNVSLEFTAGDDAFVLKAVSTRDDLLTQLEWIAAVLSDSAYRPEVEGSVRAKLGGIYSELGHTAAGPLNAMLPRLLASNDPRFGLPPLRETIQRSMRELRDWLDPQLKSGPLELTIVGDFPLEDTIAEIAQTIGALPERHPGGALTVQRFVTFPTPPLRWDYDVHSEIPSATVGGYWPTEAPDDERRRDRLELLALVLQDRVRLKLREQLGAAYTPEATSYAPVAFPGYGYIRAQATVDPARASVAAAALAEIGASLARHTISADELERARRPLAARARDVRLSNIYWLETLAQAQSKPSTLDWPQIRLADLEAANATEINLLAEQIFRPSQLCIAVVRPVK